MSTIGKVEEKTFEILGHDDGGMKLQWSGRIAIVSNWQEAPKLGRPLTLNDA